MKHQPPIFANRLAARVDDTAYNSVTTLGEGDLYFACIDLNVVLFVADAQKAALLDSHTSKSTDLRILLSAGLLFRKELLVSCGYPDKRQTSRSQWKACMRGMTYEYAEGDLCL